MNKDMNEVTDMVDERIFEHYEGRDWGMYDILLHRALSDIEDMKLPGVFKITSIEERKGDGIVIKFKGAGRRTADVRKIVENLKDDTFVLMYKAMMESLPHEVKHTTGTILTPGCPTQCFGSDFYPKYPLCCDECNWLDICYGETWNHRKSPENPSKCVLGGVACFECQYVNRCGAADEDGEYISR